MSAKSAPTLVDPDYKLLLTGYDYMGVMLDLYGDRDEDGFAEVCDVCLTGDKRSLGVIFSSFEKECAMPRAIDRADDIALIASKAQGKIDRAEHDRSMDKFDGRRAL